MIYKMLFVYALISAAVIMDYKYFKISNSLNMWGLISAIFLNLFLYEQYNLYSIAIGLAIPFLLLYPVFMIGGIGAGDVKLLCVIGIVIGMKSSIRFTAFCFVIAGIIGISKLLFLQIRHLNNKRYSMHKIHFSYAIFVASILEPIINNIYHVSGGGFL